MGFEKALAVGFPDRLANDVVYGFGAHRIAVRELAIECTGSGRSLRGFCRAILAIVQCDRGYKERAGKHNVSKTTGKSFDVHRRAH